MDCIPIQTGPGFAWRVGYENSSLYATCKWFSDFLQALELARVYLEVDDWRQRGYFLVRVDNDSDTISILPLCDVKKVSVAIPDGEDVKKAGGVYLGVADPCPLHDHPGWPLRNLLALLSYHWYALSSL